MLQCPLFPYQGFQILISVYLLYGELLFFANAYLCLHFDEEQRQNNEERNRKSGGDERDLVPDAKSLRQTNGGERNLSTIFFKEKCMEETF
jgi:hypothetical protein